jgi:hypothetical protein
MSALTASSSESLLASSERTRELGRRGVNARAPARGSVGVEFSPGASRWR